MSGMSGEPRCKKQKFADYKSRNRFRNNKKYFLEAGQRGFFATCNFKEKECVRECYNILNEYADELYGPEQRVATDTERTSNISSKGDTVDISDELEKEINASSCGINNKQLRFQVVNTSTSNCVFIKTDLADPVELGQYMICDIAKKKAQKSRFILRLLPIEMVCHANIDDILKTAGQLCDKYFLKQGCSYSIVFNRRYNNTLKRDHVIQTVAELVQSKNVHNKVDLKQPTKSLVIEVIKGVCCMTVLENYFKYKKYNLSELINSNLVSDAKIEEKVENGTDSTARKSETNETQQDDEIDKSKGNE